MRVPHQPTTRYIVLTEQSAKRLSAAIEARQSACSIIVVKITFL
jgi:hypothetical protein